MSTQSKRYVGLDVHKHYVMVGAVEQSQQVVLRPRKVALVELDEGPLVTGQLTDVDQDEIEIGMPVEMVTRKLREEGEDGLIVYGYKFRPILAV